MWGGGSCQIMVGQLCMIVVSGLYLLGVYDDAICSYFCPFWSLYFFFLFLLIKSPIDSVLVKIESTKLTYRVHSTAFPARLSGTIQRLSNSLRSRKNSSNAHGVAGVGIGEGEPMVEAGETTPCSVSIYIKGSDDRCSHKTLFLATGFRVNIR